MTSSENKLYWDLVIRFPLVNVLNISGFSFLLLRFYWYMPLREYRLHAYEVLFYLNDYFHQHFIVTMYSLIFLFVSKLRRHFRPCLNINNISYVYLSFVQFSLFGNVSFQEVDEDCSFTCFLPFFFSFIALYIQTLQPFEY